MVPYLVKIHYFQNKTIYFYSGMLPVTKTVVRKKYSVMFFVGMNSG